MSEHTAQIGVSVAIKAQNPDLETAWRTIAWWEQTCAYWNAQAQKGYALRDSLDTRLAQAWEEGYLTGDPYHRRGQPEDNLALNPYRDRAGRETPGGAT